VGTSCDSHPTPATKLLDSHKRSDRGACGFVLVGNCYLSVTQITGRPKLAGAVVSKSRYFQHKNALFFFNRTHSTNNGSRFVAPAAHLHRPDRP
jgi:hypothetical protein